jgi:hypothetical protein
VIVQDIREITALLAGIMLKEVGPNQKDVEREYGSR